MFQMWSLTVLVFIIRRFDYSEAQTCNSADCQEKSGENLIVTESGGKCYVLSQQANTFGAQACDNYRTNKMNNPSAFSYSRIAYFPDANTYQQVISALTSGCSVPLWVGVRAESTWNYASDYCWMTTGSGKGSQFSSQQTSFTNILNSGTNAAHCLFVDSSNPFVFSSDVCDQGAGYYYICEMGCYGGSNVAPATCSGTNAYNTNNCGSGVCDVSGIPSKSSSSPTKTACPTTKPSTVQSSTLKATSSSSASVPTVATVPPSFSTTNTKQSTQTNSATTGCPAACTNLGGYQAGNTCFVLYQTALTWNDAYTFCKNTQTNFPSATYGRLATFPDSTGDMYNSVLNYFNKGGIMRVWIGASTDGSNLQLLQYCWRTDLTTYGSQITANNNAQVIQDGNTVVPWCLSVEITASNVFYAGPCNDKSYAFICEFGKEALWYQGLLSDGRQ